MDTDLTRLVDQFGELARPLDFESLRRRVRRRRARRTAVVAATLAGALGLSLGLAFSLPGGRETLRVVTPAGSPPAHTGPAQATVTAPEFTLTPSSGPVGTTVTFRGRLTSAQIPIYGPELARPGYFALLTDVAAECAAAAPPGHCAHGPANLRGCELILGLDHPLVRFNPTTGAVSGSFRVGRTGSCFQTNPVAGPVPALPGRYSLGIGAHASSFASFVITHAIPLPAEPCVPVTMTADGNPSPEFCPDGHPNRAADRLYRDQLQASVLTLGPDPTPSQIHGAICADLGHRITKGEEDWALAIASAEQGWGISQTEAFQMVTETKCQ
ncbi:MAG: hypothetical protein ACYCO3_08395 [Mycobacteriales bacterium]